jgi:hypothetical protein
VRGCVFPGLSELPESVDFTIFISNLMCFPVSMDILQGFFSTDFNARQHQVFFIQV